MLNNIVTSTEAFTPLEVMAVVGTAKGVANKIATAKNGLLNDNLIQATQSTRIEPMALIDSTIVNEPFMTDLLTVSTKLFASYYLRAIELSSTIDGIDVAQRIGKFNPDRSVIDAVISTASHDVAADYPQLGMSYQVSNEDKDDAKKPAETGSKPLNDVAGSLKQMDNLALGMALTVKFTNNGEAYSMPVNVRLIPISAAPSVIVQTFEVAAVRNSRKERWHRFKAGELSLIGDLILCNDLIDSHRKAEIKDKSGFYTEANRRRRNNAVSAAISGDPSVATCSNILIVSSRTAAAIESDLEGELMNYEVRERAFKETSAMILIVVNQDWERVTIYSRTIRMETTLLFRDFKNVNSKSGAGVEDILRMYQEAAKPNARTGVMF